MPQYLVLSHIICAHLIVFESGYSDLAMRSWVVGVGSKFN